jgi:serine protease inhibitor
MLLVLPSERNGLGKLEQELTAARLQGWVDSLEKKHVWVALPKFELRSTLALKSSLQKLGMKRAFGSGEADFSGMSTCAGLVLDNAYHQAWVKVDEKHTEAAAATGAVMRPVRGHIIQARFIADHPFLFAIRHRASGTLLFLGHVAAP